VHFKIWHLIASNLIFLENQLTTVFKEYDYIWGLATIWGPAKIGGIATIWKGGLCPPTPAWNNHCRTPGFYATAKAKAKIKA